MPAPQIHVYLEHATARARYAVQEVLETMLGWKLRWEDDRIGFDTLPGPKLIYGQSSAPGAMHIVPAGLLSEEGLRPIDPEVVDHGGLPLLFPVSGGHLPFDPFAAAFHLLTRYEELLGVACDAHGRPLAERLHGARHGYLHRAVVDEWSLLLARTWRGMDAKLPIPQRTYRSVNSMDLDNGFKYLGRPLWRTLGSMARDAVRGSWAELPARLRVLAGRDQDPFDIYTELQEPLSQGASRVLFFVLAAPRGDMDHAVPVEHPLYAQRLRALTSWAEVGLHPSYASSAQQGLTALESLRLEAVLGRPVRLTRQHFLRMRLPETYRELERLGIAEEHSMGFHEHLGFRAGTCTPYRWYDVMEERTTALMVHPFSVMDNTLRHKLKLDPEQALQQVAELVQHIRAVDGTFTGLWHESFLSRSAADAPWRDAILGMIQLARP
jgi:hypothetical protein